MDDKKYLQLAIEKSKESVEKGLYPAGALVVLNDEILASEISSPFPDPRHADNAAIMSAFDKQGSMLNDVILYSSMEPCLMCLTQAYWAGIKRIVFALKKQTVKNIGFEGDFKNEEVIEKFSNDLEMVHQSELEDQAFLIYKEWQNKNL